MRGFWSRPLMNGPGISMFRVRVRVRVRVRLRVRIRVRVRVRNHPFWLEIRCFSQIIFTHLFFKAPHARGGHTSVLAGNQVLQPNNLHRVCIFQSCAKSLDFSFLADRLLCSVDIIIAVMVMSKLIKCYNFRQ
jgi:hypothetical protein